MFDVCVVGAGGIVGCAIARELAMQGLSTAGIEKHDGTCRETSGLNSRVIHSGFHEARGTLKAELAREGSELIVRYAEDHHIDLLRTAARTDHARASPAHAGNPVCKAFALA